MALKRGGLDQLRPENIYNVFLGLQPREQTMALVGAVAMVVLLIVIPITLANSRLGKLQKTIDQGRTQMGDIVRAIEDYNQKKSELSAIEGRLRSGFDASLSSSIESLASQAGLKENVDSLKERPSVPSDLYNEVAIEVRLSKLTLKQLTDFLYQIEHSPTRVLKVDKLRIKPRFDNKQQLDASFDVLTYQLQEEKKEDAPPPEKGKGK